MKKYLLSVIFILCLFFTSCAEILNGVWTADSNGDASSDYSLFAGTTWKMEVDSDTTRTISFYSDGTYLSTSNSLKIKGNYTCAENTVTLVSVNYVKGNGKEWSGTCNIECHYYLKDGLLYLYAYKSETDSDDIEGTWNYSSSFIYTDTNSDDVIGIGVRTWKYNFNDGTFTCDYNLELVYDNVADDVETSSSDNGTYSVSGSTVSLVYSDNSTETLILKVPYLVYETYYFSLSSLSAPTGLTVTGTTYDTATLSWNSVKGATSYTVYYGASSSYMTNTITSETTSCTVTGVILQSCG